MQKSTIIGLLCALKAAIDKHVHNLDNLTNALGKTKLKGWQIVLGVEKELMNEIVPNDHIYAVAVGLMLIMQDSDVSRSSQSQRMSVGHDHGIVTSQHG